MHPIEAAVAHLKADAMDRAEKEARDFVALLERNLRSVDGNLDELAPRPHARMDRSEYRHAEAMRAMYKRFTRPRNPNASLREPDIRDLDAAAVDRYIRDEREGAAAAYVAFVHKLIGKIGPVQDAKLDGNWVWKESTLWVTLPDGGREGWRTKQIVNRSVLGKLFNQWPTRQIAGEKRETPKDERPVHLKVKRYGYTTKACVASARAAQKALATRLTDSPAEVTCEACKKVMAALQQRSERNALLAKAKELTAPVELEHEGKRFKVQVEPWINGPEARVYEAGKSVAWKQIEPGASKDELFYAVLVKAVAPPTEHALTPLIAKAKSGADGDVDALIDAMAKRGRS